MNHARSPAVAREVEFGTTDGFGAAASPLQARRAGDLRLFTMALHNLRRNLWFGLAILVATVGLALLLVAVRPHTYTAVARLTIEDLRVQLANQSVVVTPGPVTEAVLRTQIEILGSPAIAQRVIAGMGLTNDPEFRPGRLRRFLDTLELQARGDLPYAAEQSALAAFAARRSVRRIGESDVIELRFTSDQPEKAVRIAQAVLDLYTARLREDNERIAQAATPALRERIREVGIAARLIAAPVNPAQSDGPRAANILVAGMLLGTLFGIGGALVRGALRRRIWRPEELADSLGANRLWLLKDLDSLLRKAPLLGRAEAAGLTAPAGTRLQRRLATFYGTMGRIAAAAKRAQLAPVIGVTAFAEGAGRSATALGLARTMAAAGETVLLIDADLETRSLSALLATEGAPGLVQALESLEGWERNCLPAEERISFLATGGGVAPVTRYLIESGRLNGLLSAAQRRHSAIVLDLPLMPAAGGILDATPAIGYRLLVIHPGTGSDRITQTLGLNLLGPRQAIADGVLFNRLATDRPSWIELRR